MNLLLPEKSDTYLLQGPFWDGFRSVARYAVPVAALIIAMGLSGVFNG